MAKCPHCGKEYAPVLAQRPDYEQRRVLWRNGMYIQDAWPESTAEEREQLLTGVCSTKCWNEFLGGAEDPE
jgi:hypothetical protein